MAAIAEKLSKFGFCFGNVFSMCCRRRLDASDASLMPYDENQGDDVKIEAGIRLSIKSDNSKIMNGDGNVSVRDFFI